MASNFLSFINKLFGSSRADAPSETAMLEGRSETKPRSHAKEERLTFNDPVFGTFTHDPAPSWFEATIEWNGVPARISLTVNYPDKPDMDNLQEIAKSAQIMWAERDRWLVRCLEQACTDLLELANDWQTDIGPVSANEFKSRVRFDSLHFWDNDWFDMWLFDCDLFWGHGILVRCSLSNGTEVAEIHG
jgi:hypothetical protein